ncbi:MAG: helicase [Deltaproteobacteria bacterium]|nr:MAG: helicase [Deltaproteobacteria bacterium]
MKIKKNTNVKVTYRPELGTGAVLQVAEAPGGEYQLDVVFEKDGKRFLETFPQGNLTPVADIFQRYQNGESDHPTDFFLKQLAYQIPLENSGGELSNSKTDLLPHQILLTHQIISSRRRKFLIADEVGLGKTIEVGMIVKELLSRGEAKRILVICPAGLTVNWQNEMKDCFRIFFDIFGRDFSGANPHAWERHSLVIVSIDTIKKPQRLEKMMTGPEWDLIVFDEAHHLSRKRYGKKIDITQNYRLAEKAKGKARDLLFLTATPHQGDAYQFWSLIQLLDDQLFEEPEAMLDHRGLLGRVMFRRTKRETTDVQGNPIFMRRQVHTQQFQLSMREQRFYDSLTEYLKEGYDAAGVGQDKTTKQQRAVGFVMATFQKIMSSSPRAIKQALRRRMIVLYARKQMSFESGAYGAITRPEISAKIISYQEKMRKIVRELLSYRESDIDYTVADAYITRLKQKIMKRPRFAEEVTHWALDAMESGNGVIEAEANIPNEEEKIKELIELVDEGPDRKFDTLVRAIEQIRRENKNEKMIIFTQYLETLYFLQDEIGKYYDPKKIAIVKGGPLEDKIASCESFWDEDGAQFLISTSAGGEGINLQVCRILFNYDLPWNPMAVEQRIGRIHRYGQTETVQVYHLVAEGTIEEKVYAILEEKLFEIAMTIGKVNHITGDVSEDFRSEILGFLGSSTNYTSLYREALLYRDYERTEQEIAEAILVAKDASEALRQLTQDLSSFNLEYYRKLEGKFTLEDLQRFTEKAILRMGGSFIPSGEIIQITVPPVLKKYPDVASRYDNVTFSRKTATRKRNVDLLGIGHPLLDALIDYYKSESVPGELLNVKCDDIAPSLTARHLFIIEFEDGSRREEYYKFLLEGENIVTDFDYLFHNDFKQSNELESYFSIKDKLKMFIQNQTAIIKSKYEGVVNIRYKCIGIQAIN